MKPYLLAILHVFFNYIGITSLVIVIDYCGVLIVVAEIYRLLQLVIIHSFLYHFRFVIDGKNEQYNCEIVFYIP